VLMKLCARVHGKEKLKTRLKAQDGLESSYVVRQLVKQLQQLQIYSQMTRIEI